MSPFSYRLVTADGQAVQGTDYTGAHDTVEAFAAWHRDRDPHLAEVAVWEGELADRPDHTLALLKEAVGRSSSGDALANRGRVFRGAVALDVFEPRRVA